jgi:hypothetical protein
MKDIDKQTEQIYQFLFSGIESNIELALRLEEGLNLDLSDFWSALSDVYNLLNNSVEEAHTISN